MVDVVSEAVEQGKLGGVVWTKVSTVTETRLVHELAKAGYGWESSSDEEEGNGEGESDDDEDEEPEGLLKVIHALVRARSVGRIRYAYPVLRLVLPRIEAQCVAPVEQLLAKITRLGVQVICGPELEAAKPVREVAESMRGDPYARFTGTLNIDCTLLLALVSDLSHGSVGVEDWQHVAIQRQIVREAEDQLLPRVVYPALEGRKLVCSTEAANRCREIVATIGTSKEKARTDLIFEKGPAGVGSGERVKRLQELSNYAIPTDLCLPIQEVDVDIPGTVAKLGTLGRKVAEKLTVINQSVFLYGWAEGITTISSNRVVAREIEGVVEGNRTGEEGGPDVWICPTARSLVGKEKVRRGANGKMGWDEIEKRTAEDEEGREKGIRKE